MRIKMTQLIAAAAALTLAAGSANASPVTIFSHTFDEGTGALNDTPVDSGTAAPQNWVAFSGVDANGVFNINPAAGSASGGSATLAFSPTNGFEYTLDARILNITGDGNWVALGFANGQSTAAGPNDRFINGNVAGTAWMFVRGDNSANANVAQNGSGALAPIANGGLGDGVDWTALNNNGGSFDLRILLDTTGGTGNWTATWLAKQTTDATYTTVRSTAAVLASSEANYNTVGFAFSSTTADGTIQSFSLTQVPEPGSLALLGLGGLLIARRRRD